MRKPASSDLSFVETEKSIEINTHEENMIKNHLQSSFWGLSIFTLLFALALLSILNLGQSDH